MKFAYLILVLCLPFAFTVSAVAAEPEPPGLILREFIYSPEAAPFPGVHASTIAETPGGLVTAFFGGTDEGEKDVGIWVSRHVDGKWTRPVEVANGVQHKTLRYPCWNPVLFQYPQGQLQLYYKVGPDPAGWWGMLTESTDNGATWSWPRRLPQTIDGPVKNKPVLLANGDLLCGSSIEYDGYRVHFEITPDRGRTWERIGPINARGEFTPIQPTILRHRDGSLQALCRNEIEGKIGSTTSTDNGRTWTKMVATELPNPDAGIDAVTLKNGRHLLIYNHTLRKQGTPNWRHMLNLAMTEDGEHWQAAMVVEVGQGEFSYPAIIQTSDGLVHATYTWRRKLVRHVVIDPEKLELTPIVNGIWPGYPQAGVKD
ncbi:MAG: sialidase family protein [Planctomycetaceae bacterium]